jgi:PAS domain S-box-containing protein
LQGGRRRIDPAGPQAYERDDDVTGQNLAEEERQRLFTLSLDLLCVAGTDGYFKQINPAWSRTLGWSDGELLSKPWLHFVHPDDRDATVWAGDQLRAGEAVYNFENRYRCRDGTYRWFSWNAVPLPREEIFIAVARDITEQQQAQEALRRAKEVADEARIAAEASNRAKSIFLANMSHELRTPLNAILGFSQIMVTDSNLTPDQRENLRLINRSGAHLLSIINEVLELSEVEVGQADLYLTEFDLHRMLQGLEDTFRLRAGEKGLSLTLARGPGVPRYLHGDQSKLRQVLTNLLSNAINYTEAGRVELRVQARPVAEANVPGALELYFEVEDTGVGMAPEELETLLIPFVQTASGRQARAGAGLGVPLSAAFVRLMGGELIVSSQPGAGTLFRFHILAEALGGVGPEAARPEPDVAWSAREPCRLLIAEDMEANQELLLTILKPLGLELRTAADGRQALEIWQSWRPHLILMDVRMPVVDGLEATRRIKAMPQGRDTVIVALTAHTLPHDKKAIEAAGCDDFLPKPLHQEALFDTLRRHLGLSLVREEVARSDTDTQPGTVPAPWRAEVRQAAVDADLDRLLLLADQIQERDAALAGTVRDWAYRFDYDMILDWLDRLGSAPDQDGDEDAEGVG